MQLVFFIWILFLPSVLSGANENLPWQARHAEGWAWYHDFGRPKEKEIVQETPKDPIAIMAEAKVDLERSLATAMLEPTHENVAAYMALQQKWIRQAAMFSRVWQQNMLEYPELASQTPTTQYGVQARKEVESKRKKTLIKRLAANHTLLFFYEGKNAFSRAFSEVVQDFSSLHQWNVKAISADGIILKNFSGSIRDKSIAEEMGVTIFPALYLVNVATMQATPIAFGLVTTNQIEENILIQFEGP